MKLIRLIFKNYGKPKTVKDVINFASDNGYLIEVGIHEFRPYPYTTTADMRTYYDIIKGHFNYRIPHITTEKVCYECYDAIIKDLKSWN